jgi:hypothetical protein
MKTFVAILVVAACFIVAPQQSEAACGIGKRVKAAVAAKPARSFLFGRR